MRENAQARGRGISRAMDGNERRGGTEALGRGQVNEGSEATGSDALPITGKVGDAKSTSRRAGPCNSTHAQLGDVKHGVWVICSGRGWIVWPGEETPEIRATPWERKHCRTETDTHTGQASPGCWSQKRGVPEMPPVHTGKKASVIWGTGTTLTL